jgi:hypothetical protein
MTDWDVSTGPSVAPWRGQVAGESHHRKCDHLSNTTNPRNWRYAGMDMPRSPVETASALLKGSHSLVESLRREREEIAEVLRASRKAILQSREVLARSRAVMRELEATGSEAR